MKLPRFDYAEPRSLAEACALLQNRAGEAQAIAGGTDLLLALKNQQKSATLLVDLAGISGLDRIEFSESEGLRLGALVSLRRLCAHPLVEQRFPVLAQAALAAGTVQLRAMGTVGGNLCQDSCCLYFNRSAMGRQMLEPCHKLGGEVCHVVQGSPDCWANYAGDLAPALLALRARVTVVSLRGERSMPLGDLYARDGRCPIALEPGELVAEIQLPAPPPRSGGAYLKLRPRETLDYPLLGVAVQLVVEEGGVCQDAVLALTAVDRAPVAVEEAQRLKGRTLSDAAVRELGAAARKAAHPMKNTVGFPPGYRQEMVDVYVRRAFRRAYAQAVAA